MQLLQSLTMFIVHLFVTCAAQSINVFMEEKDNESYEKGNFTMNSQDISDGSFHVCFREVCRVKKYAH